MLQYSLEQDHLAFVPKPPALRGRVDRAAGKALAFHPLHDGREVDVIAQRGALDVAGLSGVERDGDRRTVLYDAGLTPHAVARNLDVLQRPLTSRDLAVRDVAHKQMPERVLACALHR